MALAHFQPEKKRSPDTTVVGIQPLERIPFAEDIDTTLDSLKTLNVQIAELGSDVISLQRLADLNKIFYSTINSYRFSNAWLIDDAFVTTAPNRVSSILQDLAHTNSLTVTSLLTVLNNDYFDLKLRAKVVIDLLSWLFTGINLMARPGGKPVSHDEEVLFIVLRDWMQDKRRLLPQLDTQRLLRDKGLGLNQKFGNEDVVRVSETNVGALHLNVFTGNYTGRLEEAAKPDVLLLEKMVLDKDFRKTISPAEQLAAITTLTWVISSLPPGKHYLTIYSYPLTEGVSLLYLLREIFKQLTEILESDDIDSGRHRYFLANAMETMVNLNKIDCQKVGGIELLHSFRRVRNRIVEWQEAEAEITRSMWHIAARIHTATLTKEMLPDKGPLQLTFSKIPRSRQQAFIEKLNAELIRAYNSPGPRNTERMSYYFTNMAELLVKRDEETTPEKEA